MPEAIKPVDVEALKALVRTVPDFPKPGILFYDITTLLKDKTGFAQLIDALAAHYIEQRSTWCWASRRGDSSSGRRWPTG
jgi:adenine phosphoribosyltransferase